MAFGIWRGVVGLIMPVRRAGILETSYTRGPAPALDDLTRDALAQTLDELGILDIMAGHAPVRAD